MDIGIVEYGDELSGIFMDEIRKQIADVSFVNKKALDLMDCLAFLKQLANREQLILIAEIDKDEDDEIHAFYQALATLEADTGKNIFKYFYEPGESSEEGIKSFAEIFINYLFHPERLKEETTERGPFTDFEPPEISDQDMEIDTGD